MINNITTKIRTEIQEQRHGGQRTAELTLPVNSIIHGNALEVLRSFPSESIDMCVTSPPYWGLRVYGTYPQIWGGDPNCEHKWSEALEFHSIREKTTSGKTRTTQRYYGKPSRK